MIKCVFFDMDGVLVNTEPLHYEIWKQVFAEQGIQMDYEHYKGCIGSNSNRLCELILQGYGKDFRGNEEILKRFAELKNAHIKAHGLPEIAGARTTVAELRRRGYRLAVVSSSPREYIEYIVEKLGVSDCFEALLSGDKIAHPKPAPDIYLSAAEALEVKPEECAVVEDSENGSRAAKAAGMTCFGFRNPDSGDQDLSAADQVFDSFEGFFDHCILGRQTSV